jgi:hypothetical protein
MKDPHNLKKIFEFVRDNPGMSGYEMAVLMEVEPNSIMSVLTALYDENLVSREKKLPTSSNPANKVERPVYHYTTKVAEFRWDRKPRKVKVRPIVYADAAPQVPAPAPTTAGIQQTRSPVPGIARTLLATTTDPVQAIVAQINNLPYNQVKQLKKELAELFE